MAKRLQELKYHPLGGVVPENAIVLIKDNTTAEYYEDYKLSFQDFTAKLVRQTETSTSPLVNQIPRLIAGTGGVPALPAISGEFLVNAVTAIPVGTDVVYGKLKLSASTSSTSGVTGGFAATPSAVKATYDAAAKKATAETVTANWVFSGTITFNNALNLGVTGSTVGKDATGVFLKNDGTDFIYVKHTGGAPSGLVFKVGATEYKVFHEGNDGTSSGIDADLLDGFHANVFPQKAVAETISGNWNFSGATNAINGLSVTSLSVTDRATLTGGADLGNTLNVQTNTRLSYSAATGADFQNVATDNAIRLHTQAYPIYRSGLTEHKIFHSGYMGVAAGLDAGTLDGANRSLFGELAQNETVTGAWTFSGNAVFTGTLTGTLTGSASSLTTARTINGTAFDGTANITTVNWGTSRNITIGNTLKAVNGSANLVWTLAEIGALGASDNAVSATKLETARLINGTAFDGTLDITTINWGTARNITIGSTSKAVNGSVDVSWSLAEIGALGESANAVSATKLQTARTINGTSFNGTANITTANWGTSRTLTIGSSGKTVNGSANVSWSLAEIGALGVADNAVSATKLQTARLINGTAFDGTLDITTSLWGASRTLTIGLTGKTVNGSVDTAWSLAEIGALALTGGTLTGTLTGTQFLASSTSGFMNSTRPTFQGLFMDTTRTAVGGPSATGVISLRPQGVASTTGEMVVNANGTITASADGTAATHLVRKGQMDTQLGLKASLAGATFTGKVTFNNSATGINIQGGTGTSGTSGDFRFNTAANEFEGYSLGEWRPIGGGSGVKWVAVSASTTAEVGTGYLINAGGLTITLPTAPETGESVGIGDYNGKNHSVTVARNGANIMGKAENFTFNVKNANIVFSYVDATVGWILTQGFGENEAPQAIANKRRATNVVGQSTFSIPNNGSAYVDVWYNGLKLDPATDYTVDSVADTITLAVPVSANDDIIEIYAWNQALVVNASDIVYDNTTTKAPATSMQAAIDYAIQQPSGMKNRVINGKMEIAQRGTNFPAVAHSTYTLDRWRVGYSTSAVTTVSKQPDAPAGGEFLNSLRVSVTTASASVASGDYSGLYHFIEGYNVSDLIGRPFTISFKVRSSKSGVHCISLNNGGSDRSYIAEYVVNSPNTWESKTITIPAGLITSGSWDWTNGRGLNLIFVLACGVNYQTSPYSWVTGSFLATANQVNCLDTVGNIFAITGVQLEAGETATPFEHRLYGQELALCQRYYSKSYAVGTVPGTATAVGSVTYLLGTDSTYAVAFPIRFPHEMRSAPTVNLYDMAGTIGKVTRGVNGASCDVNDLGASGYTIVFYSGVSAVLFQAHYVAVAEL